MYIQRRSPGAKRERMPGLQFGLQFPYDKNHVYKKLFLLMSLESKDTVCLKAIFDKDNSTIALMVVIVLQRIC